MPRFHERYDFQANSNAALHKKRPEYAITPLGSRGYDQNMSRFTACVRDIRTTPAEPIVSLIYGITKGIYDLTIMLDDESPEYRWAEQPNSVPLKFTVMFESFASDAGDFLDYVDASKTNVTLTNYFVKLSNYRCIFGAYFIKCVVKLSELNQE